MGKELYGISEFVFFRGFFFVVLYSIQGRVFIILLYSVQKGNHFKHIFWES